MFFFKTSEKKCKKTIYPQFSQKQYKECAPTWDTFIQVTLN